LFRKNPTFHLTPVLYREKIIALDNPIICPLNLDLFRMALYRGLPRFKVLKFWEKDRGEKDRGLTDKNLIISHLPPTVPLSCPASPNATATAAAGSNQPPRWVRVTRRAAAYLFLCPPQRRLASRPSHLPSTVPCPAMTRPRAFDRIEAPRGHSQPHRCGALPNLPVHRRGLFEGGEPHARCPFPRRLTRQPTLRAFRPFRRALLSARAGLFIPF